MTTLELLNSDNYSWKKTDTLREVTRKFNALSDDLVSKVNEISEEWSTTANDIIVTITDIQETLENLDKEDVGLGNVDNTADIKKPVSIAQRKYIDASIENVRKSLNKNGVGLGNVDNTSDVNKPVSTAQRKAIDDAISGLKLLTTEATDIIVEDEFLGTEANIN